jgi:hypothetical protein
MSMIPSHYGNSRPKIAAMARQYTAEEHLTTLRVKTTKLVADTLREHDEYRGHLHTYSQTINQLHGPMSPVSIPWIHTPTLQMIRQHLIRADNVCKREVIQDTIQYSLDLKEVGNIVKCYHNLLTDVNYMVRWIKKTNRNWESVAQMLRDPICQFTYPRKFDEVPRGGYQLPEVHNYFYSKPLDPDGVWDSHNPSVHWPPKARQRKFLASKIKETSQNPDPVEFRSWLPEPQYRAMRRIVGQANVPTTGGSQPQAYPPYTLFGNLDTTEPSSPQRPKALLVKEVQQLSISDSGKQLKSCPPTKSSQGTTLKSYSQAVTRPKPR